MARGKGEGSIYKRADGYWVGSIEAGRYPNGKRRKARVVRKRKVDVLAGMAELRQQLAGGIVPDRTTTVTAFFAFWLDTIKKPNVSAGTYRQYEQHVGYVNRTIGHHKLGMLKGAHVQYLLSVLEAEGKSAAVRHQVLTVVVRPALQYAVDEEMIARNVSKGVKGPKVEQAAKTDDTPEVDEVAKILAAAKGDSLYPLAWMALNYGFRQGELIGLTWDDVDFDRERVTVRKSKTPAGERTVPLLPELADILKAHKTAQAAEQLAAPRWGGAKTVFTGTRYGVPGHALTGRAVRTWWHALMGKAGVADRRFHSTRHAAATMMLEDDVEMVVISKTLGHKSTATTEAVYSRVRADLQRRKLSGAIAKRDAAAAAL